jgi:hypothetical protein
MAVNTRNSIVTNGLVLALDAGNTKSYVSGSTTWFDISGNNNSGSLVGNPVFSSGNGGSFAFNQTNYITRGTSINAGSNFSVFSWVRPANIDIRNAIVGNSYNYTSTQGFYFATATNYVGTLNAFFVSVGADVAYRMAANNSIQLNQWNYIGAVVTNGGSNIRLYANGVETSYNFGTFSTNTILYDIAEFNIGRRITSATELFNGSIAQVKIYNRLLSQQEITQNYNATKTRFGLS